MLPAQSEIDFLLDTNLQEKLGPEGYKLSVNINYIGITAATPAGLFYGSQTLLQLLPPEIFSASKVKHHAWTAPCAEITDSPRFVWRGFMLDVSRHFFSVPEVKQVLDLMALYKLNTFHWHLVDDQGWRIEIKQYPKLTSVGACARPWASVSMQNRRAPTTRRADTAVLHAEGDPRSGRLRGGAEHHDRAGNRNAWPLDGPRSRPIRSSAAPAGRIPPIMTVVSTTASST